MSRLSTHSHSTRSLSSKLNHTEPPTGPQPLTYQQLARGALYNAAQPSRHERPTPHALLSESTVDFHSRPPSRYSVADLSAGHLFNPTSSINEVDPPTWPAHGMENVPASTSPYRSYRVERPRSPPLAKPHTTRYQGRRPDHHVVASGALYNPYVQTRLPDHLQPEETKVLERRATTTSSHLHQPAPRTPLKIPEVEPVLGQNTVAFPGGNPRSSVHFTNVPSSHEPSVKLPQSRAPSPFRQGSHANMAPSGFGEATHHRTVSEDDSIYYHPSREGSLRRVPEHEHPAGSMHPSRGPSRAPTVSGSVHGGGPLSRASTVLMRPTPWMQQEHVDPDAFSTAHPVLSRAHSPLAESTFRQHSRDASLRGPSSLHHDIAHPPGSYHPSRAPSVNDGAFINYAGSQHSRAPSVNGSQRFGAGGYASHAQSIQHGGQDYGYPSRAPSINGGGEHHFDPGQLSRGPSDHGGGSQHFGDAGGHHSRAPSVMSGHRSRHFSDAHPSQAPAVIRDSDDIEDMHHPDAWGSGPQAAAWGQDESAWGGATVVDPLGHSASPSRASTIKGGGSLRGAGSMASFHASRTPSATHVSRFQELNGGVPSRTGSAASHRSHRSIGALGREDIPTFELPAIYDALDEGADTPMPSLHASAHPSRVPSAAPSLHRAPSVVPSVHPSRAPSAANGGSRAPSVAGSTLTTKRGKTKVGRGSGRGTPAPASAVINDSDPDAIQISVVRPADEKSINAS